MGALLVFQLLFMFLHNRIAQAKEALSAVCRNTCMDFDFRFLFIYKP